MEKKKKNKEEIVYYAKELANGIKTSCFANIQPCDSLQAKITYLEIYNLPLLYKTMSKLVRKIFKDITYSNTL